MFLGLPAFPASNWARFSLFHPGLLPLHGRVHLCRDLPALQRRGPKRLRQRHGGGWAAASGAPRALGPGFDTGFKGSYVSYVVYFFGGVVDLLKIFWRTLNYEHDELRVVSGFFEALFDWGLWVYIFGDLREVLKDIVILRIFSESAFHSWRTNWKLHRKKSHHF